MANHSLSYSDMELDCIAGWLREGLSAGHIAAELSIMRRAPVSRNAIIGIVRRNDRLAAIGFARARPGPRTKQAAKPAREATPRRAPLKRDPGKRNPVALPSVIRRLRHSPPPERGEGRAFDAARPGVKLAELRAGTCRFAVNDAAPGETHLFCAEAAEPGTSWCAHHAARCFVPARGQTFVPRAMPARLQRGF